MSDSQKILPFVPVFIKLLKGPVEYVDKSLWEKLLQYKSELTAFLLPLGLSLVLDEQDGYAYLKHIVTDEEENAVSWIPRRALTYEESIMLVLLREMMAEFEVGAATTRELIRKRREIKEYAELFFKENASRVKFLKEIDRLIDRTAENGFLDCIEQHEIADEQKFRIKKIIKARVGSEELEIFLEALTGFKRTLNGGGDNDVVMAYANGDAVAPLRGEAVTANVETLVGLRSDDVMVNAETFVAFQSEDIVPANNGTTTDGKTKANDPSEALTDEEMAAWKAGNTSVTSESTDETILPEEPLPAQDNTDTHETE